MKLKLLLSLVVVVLVSCNFSAKRGAKDTRKDMYTNPLLLQEGADASAVYHNGKYYYTHENGRNIMLWETTDITDLSHAKCKEVWTPKDPSNSQHLWDPEICLIGGKWYIYFAADDGNTDNHQLYVIENDSPDPMKGEFQMKGPIVTNTDWNWGIHPTTFEHKGVLYLLWSGWPSRRISTETQCIYIARMKDPWTLDSERVLISRPEYEWERQWINTDGSRTAYPIYVNEAPQFLRSKDSQTLIVYYAASGCWSPYYCSGILTADADSDLLDASSWTKSKDPVFQQVPEDSIFGPGSFSFIPSPDETELYMLYHARSTPNSVSGEHGGSSIRLQKIEWDKNGMPDLGKPVPIDVALPKPSGTFKKKSR